MTPEDLREPIKGFLSGQLEVEGSGGAMGTEQFVYGFAMGIWMMVYRNGQDMTIEAAVNFVPDLEEVIRQVQREIL